MENGNKLIKESEMNSVTKLLGLSVIDRNHEHFKFFNEDVQAKALDIVSDIKTDYNNLKDKLIKKEQTTRARLDKNLHKLLMLIYVIHDVNLLESEDLRDITEQYCNENNINIKRYEGNNLNLFETITNISNHCLVKIDELLPRYNASYLLIEGGSTYQIYADIQTTNYFNLYLFEILTIITDIKYSDHSSKDIYNNYLRLLTYYENLLIITNTNKINILKILW